MASKATLSKKKPIADFGIVEDFALEHNIWYAPCTIGCFALGETVAWRTMLNSRQQYGRQSEDLAARFLAKRGYKIVDRNYRTPVGEIDIIAKDRKTMVFVEVKARRTNRFGGAPYSITADKKRKITKTAQWYLKMTGQGGAKARFDVVMISNDDEIELVKNAFDASLEY